MAEKITAENNYSIRYLPSEYTTTNVRNLRFNIGDIVTISYQFSIPFKQVYKAMNAVVRFYSKNTDSYLLTVLDGYNDCHSSYINSRIWFDIELKLADYYD